MNKKTFIISLLTVFVQYYDYHLFGFLAANIATHFFPDASIINNLLNTYFIMAIAVVAKPIGAIILGSIGDLFGRSQSLMLSLITTSVASFLLFITPSNDSIGLLSAFFLLLCRMLICAFASSGSDGVRIFIFEHIGQPKQAFGLGVATCFTLLGSLTASLSATIFTSGYFPDYRWKFAFLIGSVIGIFVIIIMKITNFKDQIKVKQLPKFEEFKNQSTTSIISSNKRLFVLCVLLAGGIGSTNQFILIFFGTYNFKLLQIIDQSQMQNYISISIVLYMIFSVISGLISDKFNKYKVTFVACILILIVSFTQCYYLNRLELKPVLLFLTSSILPFITISGATILTESIPQAVRYRLFSLSHAIGSILMSSPTAFICTLLYHKTNISYVPVCYFITIILVILFTLRKLKTRIAIK